MPNEVQNYWSVSEEVLAYWSVSNEVLIYWSVSNEVLGYWSVSEEVLISSSWTRSLELSRLFILRQVVRPSLARLALLLERLVLLAALLWFSKRPMRVMSST